MNNVVELSKKMCIQTYTGEAFSLHSPSISSIHIEDIAHALSNLTRFTGHCREFYSIAEHCVHVASIVPDCYKLEALLHDAAEAYINDLSTPLKHSGNLDGYREVERRLEDAIAVRFGCLGYGIYGNNHNVIKQADMTLLKIEASKLLSQPLIPEWSELLDRIGEVPDVHLYCWNPKKSKKQFLEAFGKYAA